MTGQGQLASHPLPYLPPALCGGATWQAHAEPDAFFCFSILMGDFRDLFCQQLDNSSVGIRSTLGRLGGLLREQDYELWEHLEFVTKVRL